MRGKFLLLFMIGTILLVGCDKDTDNNNNTTTLTKDQILVQKAWQVDEVWRNISGTNSHYVRGGVNTTGVNYGSIRFIFNSDGTGTYIDEVGTSHTVSWVFSTPDKYNMQVTIGPPSAQTFTWNMVEITSSAMYNTAVVGNNILVTARYVQVP